MAESKVTLPLLPLKSGVVLPGMVFTMALESDEARVAVEAARSAGGRLLLVPHIEGRYASVGVIAEVMEEGDLPGGLPAVAVRGDQRASIGTGVPGTGEALWVEAEPLVDGEATPSASELAREYRAVLENILLSRGARQIAAQLREITEPGQLADVAGYSPDLSLLQKVQVLETIDVEDRLRLVLGWARDTLADLTLRERIKTDVEEGMEKTQREFLLRRQLEAIKKELGQLGDGDESDPDDYRSKIAERDLPENVRTAVIREIDKLERTSDQSPETGWIRTWLDTVLELPWGVESDDRLNVSEAASILDADHDGLEDVKERILEHLAVKKLQAERGLVPVDGRGSGAILALVGPPGVGKTSLGQSIATALGRKFVRVSLGGVRDEAEIRGHRRTYVGAQPGRLVRALREAGTMNPVIVLDEVDKLGADFRGDPSSALLEVLDPAQNHTFRDHYLEVDLDLSRVMFVATANVIDTIPGPLLDRMEVIRLDGYTESEKVSIARHHLVARQLERAALRDDEVVISDDALRTIAADYTREAGVRSLEREIGRLLRKLATKLASGEREAPIAVDASDVREWLGRPRFYFESADRTSVPGVATGLAVTGAGGDVLFVEASVSAGPEGLTLTGQLGDVMKESAEIAMSYVRSHATELGIDATAFAGRRFHLHVPAGAVPKDGPSAGVTMTTAIVSLLRGEPVRPVVGMTGEVTLQGRVLPIGGVKQKVLAAHRAGLTEVVLPERNGPDLEDVPEEVRQQMTFHLAGTVGDVLKAAL
ncbi:MAG TPA: endopeptidase La, partial [Acidimicrobiales bacterium]